MFTVSKVEKMEKRRKRENIQKQQIEQKTKYRKFSSKIQNRVQVVLDESAGQSESIKKKMVTQNWIQILTRLHLKWKKKNGCHLIII